MRASFLFTDVEGSTRLWETDREGMAASLEVHDQIMRKAIAAHSGHVFSTAGDAFAAVFTTADDAAQAAIEIQLGLLDAGWPGPQIKVRMGIHTGEAQERDGDYFGPTLNRAARIMSAGHGGQILLSSVTSEECPSIAATEVHDLGIHHLKDLDEPEHVFELRHPELPVVERPIKSIDIRRTNLPDYLTSFVGRGSQLETLDAAVAGHRLVELTGVGGTGKTRLAVESARRHIDDYPDGAWLIELAPVTNPQLVMTEIGATWGLRPGEGATIEEVVTRYLFGRTLLLVVDNCEHVLDSATAAIKLLLDACPNIRIVATSRESLGIPGEEIIRVPSLSLGENEGQASEAVQLFLDRAAAVTDGFDPSADDLEAIGRVCTRIDGIPLGIELAAARLRSMSPQELAQRIEDSFRILSRSAKTALPRQRTLQATIDWSHDLLKPPEQALFRRLAMFLGGFDLAAAEAVAVGDDVEEWEVLDLLDSLIDKSLVIHVADGERTRYRLLEPVRQYAQEQLVDSGESETIAAAHASHYAALVAEASPQLRGPQQMQWKRRLDVEYANIRGAFDAMLEQRNIDGFLAMGFDLLLYWMHLGMQKEGIAALLEAVAQAPADIDPLRMIKAYYCIVHMGAEITDPKAIGHARTMVELARSTGDPHLIGKAEMSLGAAIRHSTTDSEYKEHLLEGRRLLDEHPEPYWWEPDWERAVINLIFAAYLPADDERKREHVDIAIRLFEEVGDAALLAATLSDTAGLWGQADEEWLLANSRRAVEILGEIEIPYWYGHALMTEGFLRTLRNDHEAALGTFSEAAVHLADCGDVNCWANSTRGAVKAQAELGAATEAAPKLAEVIASLPILPMRDVHEARTLDLAARVLQQAGRFEQAAEVLGKALATPLDIETIRTRDEIQEPTRVALVAALGESEYARLAARGAEASTAEVFARATEWLRGD